MRTTKPNRRMLNLLGLALALLMITSSSAFAQGSIFGTVQNSDLSTPANGEIGFYGFLDNTDEEVRIETSIGAGYDAGNWFDDFQNYLTEAPGNPYAYYFFNTTNGEGAILSKSIPNNSFQQENINLGAVAWPAAPTGLTGTAVSGSTVILTWDVVPGVTWHVYRRSAGASGSFFRLDDPTGSLASPGTADSFFVDNTVDGVSAYDYMLIAEDGSGNLSPHSVVVNVNSAATVAPALVSIDPNNGSANGNTLVNIYGSNFDTNGMTATINGVALTSVTVVSPYHLTGLTPAGTVGSYDVAVNNTASALSSNVLAGAFTYNSNAAPVLAAIGAQTSDENANLNFSISASDVDGDIPVLTANGLPTGASFTDNLDGTGTFDWTPTFTDSGTYAVTFVATDALDALLADSATVAITINNVNRLPVLASIGAQSTSEGVALNFGTSATDADGDTPIMTANNLPTGASYTDNLDGTASFSWTPGSSDSGTYQVTFVATDGAFATDSTFELVTITVGNVNQLPVLAAIGPQATDENVNLNFNVSASDADGNIPLLSTSTLPTGATFNDNLDGTGTFDWTPTYADSGVYSVTFYATDAAYPTDIDSETVAITVNNVNQPPVLTAIGPQGSVENVNLNFGLSASDADGDTPIFSSTALPTGATLTDNLDGTATFDWTPSFIQSGAYPVTFYATDAVFGTAVDSELVTITITDAGNQFPVLTAVGPQGVTEGGSLSFNVSATDPEGVTPLLSADSVPANATFTDNLDGTGTFGFNPDFSQAGIYNVYFFATDDSAAVDTQIVVVTVASQNQPPVLASIGAQSTTENVNLNFGVSATDGDGDTPILTTSALPTGATFTDNLDGTGTFDWTPTFADSGTYNVTFYATDAIISADIDSEAVVITVIDAGNQTPVWTVISPQVIFEGDSLALLLDASDPDGTTPILSADSLPTNATFVDNLDGTGLFIFKPNFVQSGSYLPLFVASDGVAADTMRIDITVNESGNVPPSITPIADTSVNEGGSLVLDVSATDPENGVISLTMVTTLSHATFTDNGDGTGQMTYNPTYYDADVDTVRFIATDDGTPQLSTTEVVVVTTIDINQAPSIDSIGPFSVLTGSTLQFTAKAFDSTDANQAHRIFMTATGVPTNATYGDNGDNTGTFTFNPVVGQEGSYVVTLVATDEGTPQLSTSFPVNVNVVGVNQPPVLDSIGAQEVLEGEVLIVNVSATDPDGGFPQLFAEKGPENSSFVDNGDGTGVFTFSPSYIQSGLHSVTFKAYDGISIDKEVVLIQVDEAGNQVPVFTNLPSPSVTEGDSTFGFITGSDPEGGAISFTIDSSGILMENFVLVDSGNGVAGFAIRPDFTQSGLWDVSIIVSDGELADTSVMTVTVIEAGNQDPVLATIPQQTVTEGNLLQFTAIATDVDGTIPVLSAGALPGSATFQPYPDGTGQFSWTPGATDNGVYSVRIYAQDADFATSFDSTDVTIAVIDSNFAPLIRPDPVVQPTTVFEGEVLTYRVITTDADGTIGKLGARMSADTIGAPLVPNMTFVDSGNGAGALTFAPDATQGANDPTKYNVVFYVKDGGDTTMIRQTGTITYNCYSQNIPPSLAFQLGTGPLSVTEGDVLNFVVLATDVDGATAPVISVENVPTNAVIIGNGYQVQFSFSPDYVQAGQYSVLFIATDDLGAADSGTVIIDVIDAGNQNPQFTTVLPAIFNVAIGITSEVTVIATDPDNDAMTLSYEPAVPNAAFIDFGDGTGSFTIVADSTQLGASYPISFICVDANSAADTISTVLQVNTLLRGDADANRMYSMNDIVYLINYLYRNGPMPTPEAAADVDNSGSINVSDVAYLISYMYQSGPRPPQ